MSEKKNRKYLNSFKIFQELIINKENSDESSEDLLHKSQIIKKKELISYKNLQNIDLNTYDYIFLDRQICNKIIQDFASFKLLISEIKKKFKPELLNYRNIQTIKSEGKFCFNKFNITKIISFYDKKLKDLEISVNNKYITANDIKNKNAYFYITKSFFKGKHCFEIEIMNKINYEISFGFINIKHIDTLKKTFFRKKMIDLNNFDSLFGNFDFFTLKSPIFIKKENNIYHHYLSYGDIIGFCFDLKKKLLYLYLNGEIINTYVLNIEIDKNDSYVPILTIPKYSEIIFNPGPNLKYIYENMDFIPLDEKDKNNFELSHLIEVTNNFLEILINNGKSIINNKNITYSDINQIYYNIFDFLGNISFQYNYIIHNCFVKNIEMFCDKDYLELYYICIKYILNSVQEKKLLLNKIILNIVESIHIYLIKGDIKYKKLYQLLSYIFSKKDMINIISTFNPSILRHIFSQIFIPFSSCKNFLEKINLDSIINPNIKNNKNMILKDINTNFDLFYNNIILALDEYNKGKNYEIFSEFVENLLKNGIECDENNNIDNYSNNIIIKNLKDFFKKEKDKIIKCRDYKIRLNKIFKTFFIPAMHLFNISYNKNKNFSIKKYLTEDESEKLGGTMKNINEQIIKEIPNFEEIKKIKIKSIPSIFFYEFLDFFFCDDDIDYILHTLGKIIFDNEEFSREKLLNTAKNDSFEIMHSKLINFIEYKLSFPNLDEIMIFINFLLNFSDIFLNELYPKKLIYFFPENIFTKFKNIISLLKNLINNISPSHDDFIDCCINKDTSKNLEYKTKLQITKKNLEILCQKCLKQYISLIMKIISDKNVKKLTFKSDLLITIKNSINDEEYFTDEEIFLIFNFLTEIINNNDYKNIIDDFTKLFESGVIIKKNNNEKTITKFGERLYNLLKSNNNFLRNILLLIYNTINSSLSKLEEIFAEYKFKPKSNNTNINNNNNNNNIEEINDEGLNAFIGLIERIHNLRNNNNNNGELNHIIVIGGVNPLARRNITQLNDKEKLSILNNCLKDTYNQFIRLNNFYSLSNNIIELYDFDKFENKYLNNLLVSLYNIIFSPNNSNKINDNNVNNTYIKLITFVLEFYNNIFKNISELKNENILIELSKRRNLYHLKEISECFIKLNKDNTDIKLFNDFLIYLEKLIPEEKVKKLINNENSGIKSEEKNLCPICADAKIDTHILPCEHSICRNCFFQCLSGNKVCPFCRVKIQGIKEDNNFKIC